MVDETEFPTQHCMDMFLRQRRVVFDNLLDAVTTRQIVYDSLQRNPRAVKARLTTEDFGVDVHDVFEAWRNGGQHRMVVLSRG